MSIREVDEGRQTQGDEEKVTWTVDTANWGGSPTNESMTVKDSVGEDVTSTVTSGSTSVSGDVITLKPINGLKVGEWYKVEVQFTAGGGAPYGCYFFIDCED